MLATIVNMYMYDSINAFNNDHNCGWDSISSKVFVKSVLFGV